MKQRLDTWGERWKAPSFWLAVFFGAGLLRPAPGTWGSLAALAVGYGFIISGMGIWPFCAAILLVTVAGTMAINAIERETGVHDAPEIVIDEVSGMWIALLPYYFLPAPAWLFIAAFILFRAFDIIKPWPIGWLDRKVAGGFGVMLDDIVAGIFSFIGIILLSTFLL